MKAMKKILAFALAGVMALVLLTGCGTGSSASHKSIAKAMADYYRGVEYNPVEGNPNITCTSSPELDAKLQSLAADPRFEAVVKAVYNKGPKFSLSDIPSGSVSVPANNVIYLYCGKYDKDAGKQAINLNAHSACINTYNDKAPSLTDERQIGLITTSFTDDTTGKEVKVRFAVVVSDIPKP